MKLRDAGEFGAIARIARRAAAGRASRGAVRLGIGDDAAVLRLRHGEDLVASVDASVEDVHFRRARTGAELVGRRALVAAASDLAAMGARPVAFLFALGAPPALPLRWLDACVAGMVAEARALALPLAGGNVTRGRKVSLTITVLGAVRRDHALRRDRARAGDRLFVTGALGAAALDLVRSERLGRPRRHRPAARIEAGLRLARIPAVGACIDVSDGLVADLAHVLHASRVDVELDRARLPVPRGFAASCRRLGLDPLDVAATGGEDFELLFTLRPGGLSEAALARRLGVPVREIGRIVARRRGSLARAGRRHPASRAGGFRHF